MLCALIYTASLRLPSEQSFYFEMSTKILLKSLGEKNIGEAGRLLNQISLKHLFFFTQAK